MIAVLLAAALTFSPQAAEKAHQTADEFVNACTPRDAGTIRGRLAANWILDHASAVGANVYRDVFRTETPSGRRTMANLYSEFKANEKGRWVVLVSHFDTKPGLDCPGANDGASTSALLIALSEVLADSRMLKGNVLLVWTDGEECQGERYSEGDGLQGSRRAAAYIKERGYEVQAVLCLDMLGDRDLAISVPANGTPSLAKIACHAARRIGEPRLVRLSDLRVKDDHVAFLEAGYKAIDLIDFDYGPQNSWWHTPQDTSDKLLVDSFLKSGRLVCEMLNILL